MLAFTWAARPHPWLRYYGESATKLLRRQKQELEGSRRWGAAVQIKGLSPSVRPQDEHRREMAVRCCSYLCACHRYGDLNVFNNQTICQGAQVIKELGFLQLWTPQWWHSTVTLPWILGAVKTTGSLLTVWELGSPLGYRQGWQPSPQSVRSQPLTGHRRGLHPDHTKANPISCWTVSAGPE